MPKAMTFEEAAPTEVESLMKSPHYAAELKLDGVRSLAHVTSDEVRLLNRKGEPLRAASTNAHRGAIETELAASLPEGEWILDGEIMADGRFWLFDVIKADTILLPRALFQKRREVLVALSELVGWDEEESLIRVVAQATVEDDKRMLLDSTKRVGGEGIMFKRLDAAYVEGKRTRAGLKVKLTKTVDAVVIARNTDGHTNATLGVWDDDKPGLVEIGACSMNGKADAKVGDVVEVRFLYVGANGRLYQPRMVRVRGDKNSFECTIDQLYGLGVNKEVAA